jgi:hypothetical protein
MHSLSEYASFIFERMEPDRRYELQDLRALVPERNNEHLREIMQELWVNRQVERDGHSGWRRPPSAPPEVPQTVSGEIQAVKPEELFDHARFANFFK